MEMNNKQLYKGYEIANSKFENARNDFGDFMEISDYHEQIAMDIHLGINVNVMNYNEDEKYVYDIICKMENYNEIAKVIKDSILTEDRKDYINSMLCNNKREIQRFIFSVTPLEVDYYHHLLSLAEQRDWAEK